MWFKNCQIYRLTESSNLDLEKLPSALAEQEFVPCNSQDLSRSGWAYPLGRHGNEFIHQSNGYTMMCLKRQEKILPAAVINEQLEAQVIEIEANEDRRLPRKERMTLKDEIIFTLLPKAFTRSSLSFGYISERDQYLIIDSSSAKKAESYIDELREALGSFSVIPFQSRSQPIDVMTNWLKSNQFPQGFTPGEECELRDNSDIKSVIRFKNQDLQSSELVNLLNNGMHVSKLALNWQDRVECVIDENLAIKRLKFGEIVQEKADEAEADDVATKFDVDFSIMTLELTEFIKALMAGFGGADEGA